MRLDNRVKYTRAVLKRSLLELMGVKPINKISVKEICEVAGINRATFYAHYSDPAQLLGQIEQELMEEIERMLAVPLLGETLSGTLTRLCAVIAENSALCRILFSANGDKDFLARVMNTAKDSCVTQWRAAKPGIGEAELERFYLFASRGSCAVIEDWILSGTVEPPEDIARLLEQMSGGGLRALITK